MEAPPIGLTTKCRLERIKDGDTVVVVIERRVTVRLLDCWAPETRGKQRPDGEAARDFLASIVSPGDELVLFVPGSEAGNVAELMTFGRVLGFLWRDGDGPSLSELMVTAGHATTEKRE